MGVDGGELNGRTDGMIKARQEDDAARSKRSHLKGGGGGGGGLAQPTKGGISLACNLRKSCSCRCAAIGESSLCWPFMAAVRVPPRVAPAP